MEKSAPTITSTLKGTSWSVTINNPTEEDKAKWMNAVQLFDWVKDAKGQIEKGEKGTLHIQGMLKTKQVRFSQVQKAFPRAHIELAKNATALAKYVTKEETRVAPISSSIRYCTPADIQKELYDSCITLVCDNTISMKWSEGLSNNVLFTSAPRFPKIEASERKNHFLAKVNNIRDAEYSAWNNYFKSKADNILKTIYDDMIRKGFYGVEFISANNLTNGGFKKHLLSILIRHALHSPQENLQEEANEVEAQSETE